MRNWYRFGLALLSCTIGLTCQGQWLTPDPDSSQFHVRPWVVKFAPLSLVDITNTIQFAAERVLTEHQSVQVEFGYGWQSMNIWFRPSQTRYTQYEAWRGRAEWRYYWRYDRAPYGSYTAIEGFYKRENAFENGSVAVGNGSGPIQYYRQYSLPTSKQVAGFNIKIGRQFPISSNGRLIGDFYGGLGLRAKWVQEPNRPDGYTYFNRSFIEINPFTDYGSASVISLSYGIKIGYVL